MERRDLLASLGLGATTFGAGCLDFSDGYRIRRIQVADSNSERATPVSIRIEFDGETIFAKTVALSETERGVDAITDLPEDSGEYQIHASAPELDIEPLSYDPGERHDHDCSELYLIVSNIGPDAPKFSVDVFSCEYYDRAFNNSE